MPSKFAFRVVTTIGLLAYFVVNEADGSSFKCSLLSYSRRSYTLEFCLDSAK